MITGLIFNSLASVSCFAVECQRHTGTEAVEILKPQRNERERETWRQRDSRGVFVLKARVLLLRVERCLLGLARVVDSGPAWFNNTDQRIVIQNNNKRRAALAGGGAD